MIKKLTLFLLCMSFAMTTMAQKTDAMLFGDAKSKITGEHIPFVTIHVKGTSFKTVSDATGHFKLANLPLGTQTVVASVMGYSPQEIVVTMEQGKTTEVFFMLEDDAKEINQVVVTGTRTQHYVKNVPIRTEVVTSKALTNKNAKNMFEALEGVPGVRVEQQCQACNFSMVRMQGLGAEHTQVLIDGEPVYSGLAGVYGLQQIGVDDLDRIEVVKGAGSALYGSSAVAGAINLISKEPSYDPSVKADLQMGNWGHKSLNVSGSMRNDHIGLSVFAQRLQSDAIDKTGEGLTRDEVKKKDGVSDRVETRLNNLGFNLYFYSPFAMKDKLILRGKAMSEDRAGGVLTDDLYLNPFSEGTENIKTNRLSADLSYMLPLGSKSELNVSMAYVYHKRNATNDTFLTSYKETHKDPATGEGISPDVEIMRPYLARENSFTPSVTFSTKFGSHNLLVGAQAYTTRLRETGKYCIIDKTSSYYGQDYTSISKKHATEFGFFVQDEWNITHNLSVVPGLRVDTHKSGEEYTSDKKVFDSAFPKTEFNETSINPRLALKYEATPNFILRANIGTGFRAPYGFSEDLHLCSGSPRVWKSSDLKAEKSLSFNLSADYYGKNFQLSANIFRTNLKNKIQFTDQISEQVRNLGYTYQWENVDDAYVQGVELGAKFNLASNLTAGLNWTFNQGKFKHLRADWAGTDYEKDSRYISRFPAMTGDLNVEYTPGTWTFSLYGNLQGKMYIDYNAENKTNSKIKKTNTFTLWNFRVAKKISNMFTLYVGGKNIFSYIQDEKHIDDAAFMYAPVYGATWYAGVNVNI